MLNEANLTALIPNTPTRLRSQSYLDFFITNNPKLLYPPITLGTNPYPTETFSDHEIVASKLRFTGRTSYQEPKMKYDFQNIDRENYEKLFWTLPWKKFWNIMIHQRWHGFFSNGFFNNLCL